MKNIDDIVAGINEIEGQASELSKKSAELAHLRLMESGDQEQNLKDADEARKYLDRLSGLSNDLQNQINAVSDLLRRYR